MYGDRLRTWRGQPDPRVVEMQNKELMAPLRVSGLMAVPVEGGVGTDALLSDAEDADVVRGTLSLYDAYRDGEMATAIREGRSFGMTLGVSRGRTLLLSGAEGKDELRVRLEDNKGQRFELFPLLEPHEHWATAEPLVAAHDSTGAFFTERSNPNKLRVLADALKEIQAGLAARVDAPGSFSVRVYAATADDYMVSAFVDMSSAAHPIVSLTLRHNGREMTDLHPIVQSTWQAGRRYSAAF